MSSDTDVEVAKLTKEQYELLRFCEQWYWQKGSIPGYKDLESYGISLDESVYYEAFANARFISGLKGRGLPDHLLGIDGGPFRGKLLTEKQLTVANTLLDVHDKRSRLKKLTELGVSTNEFNSWLRDPAYRQYCLDRTEELLTSNQHVAHLSLIDRVASGDLGAIKYFNEMTGRYRSKTAAGVEINVENNYGDDKIIAIVEIIQKHVKDPEVLAAIGDDILALRGHAKTVVDAPRIIAAELEG